MADDQDSGHGTLVMEEVEDDLSIDFESAKDYFNTVRADNDFFKQMLNLVPAQGYFDHETLQKIKTQAEKEGQATDSRGKKKAEKRRKVANPISNLSVTQLQSTLNKYKQDKTGSSQEDEEDVEFTEVKVKKARVTKPEEEVEERKKEKKQKPKHRKDKQKDKKPIELGTTMSQSESICNSTDTSIVSASSNKASPLHRDNDALTATVRSPVDKRKHAKQKGPMSASADPGSGKDSGKDSVSSSSVVPTITPVPQQVLNSSTCNLDDKRAILRAKIEELQAKRKMIKEGVDKGEMRRERKENKLKRKQRRKQMKKEKGKADDKDTSQQTTLTNGGSRPSMTSPVYNSEGKMVFSKFDFTPKKKEKNNLAGKDYKRLLEKVEKRNERIQKLKQKDEGAAKSLEEKMKWDALLQKAEGQKVKDDPELLKKALKKKEKMKEKKKKKWTEREAFTQKLMDAKQDKRKKNIQARKKAKLDKKLKKAKKKGRLLPGF